MLYEVGLTFEKIGLFDQAAERYHQAQSIAKELDDPILLATGDLYLANVAWFQGNYQTAFQLLTQADKKAEAANDPQLRIMVKNTRGLIYWTLNDTDKGLLHLRDAVTLSRSSNIQTELASSLNNLGLIYRQRGDHATALDYFQQAKTLDESLKSQWGLGYDLSQYWHLPTGLGTFGRSRSPFPPSRADQRRHPQCHQLGQGIIRTGKCQQGSCASRPGPWLLRTSA